MVEKKTFLLIKYWIKLSLQYGLVHATHVATGPSVAERWNSKLSETYRKLKFNWNSTCHHTQRDNVPSLGPHPMFKP